MASTWGGSWKATWLSSWGRTVVTPPPVAPVVQAPTGGRFPRTYDERYRRETARRSELRKAYVVIRKNAKKLSAAIREEILEFLVHDGATLPPVKSVDFDGLTNRPEYLNRAEDIFARAIVEAELPEPERVSEYAPLAEFEPTENVIRLPDAPDGTWIVGLSAAISKARELRRIALEQHEMMLQDEEELILLLS